MQVRIASDKMTFSCNLPIYTTLWRHDCFPKRLNLLWLVSLFVVVAVHVQNRCRAFWRQNTFAIPRDFIGRKSRVDQSHASFSHLGKIQTFNSIILTLNNLFIIFINENNYFDVCGITFMANYSVKTFLAALTFSLAVLTCALLFPPNSNRGFSYFIIIIENPWIGLHFCELRHLRRER